jgi:hypothetical protein
MASSCVAAFAAMNLPTPCAAQAPVVRIGDPVPRDVRELYDAGCRYLARSQDASGTWQDGNQGPGITGMGLMVLLASGEDPNHGAYRVPVRKAVRHIIRSQNKSTGYFGGDSRQGQSSMYHHGFAMLGLAEAYGVVDERGLWSEDGGGGKGMSIGESLELGVKLAVASAASNPTGAWRYMPESRDADTSVSGAVMMGLLGARNAGIEVPDETIDRAIRYFTASTSSSGQVGYSGPQGGSDATTSIGSLVLAIARRKDLSQYKKASEFLVQRSLAAQQQPQGHISYTRYYRAQALLQADVDAWRRWNDGLVQKLKQKRMPDGSFAVEPGDNGPVVGTCLTLLALAVNYRFLPIYER